MNKRPLLSTIIQNHLSTGAGLVNGLVAGTKQLQGYFL